MFSFTEIVYLAAPFERPEQRAFNERLADIVRTYNFPLFMPQEAQLEIQTGEPTSPFPVDAVITNTLASVQDADEETKREKLLEICTEALRRSNLVIAVAYGDEFDSLTAFEAGYALGRGINVVAVRNDQHSDLCLSGDAARWPSLPMCARIVVTPEEHDRLIDRLIPILNRYFVPHGTPLRP